MPSRSRASSSVDTICSGTTPRLPRPLPTTWLTASMVAVRSSAVAGSSSTDTGAGKTRSQTQGSATAPTPTSRAATAPMRSHCFTVQPVRGPRAAR